MRRFQAYGGLFFERQPNGDVTITKTDGKDIDNGGTVVFQQTIDAGTWASTVLTMTAFNERPNDWHAWMDHHEGRADVLSGTRRLRSQGDDR